MKNNTIGSINTAFGESVLMNNDGSYNTGVGFDALVSNTSGGSNTALGSLALYSNTTGHDNVSAGDNTLYSNSTGSFNTAVGTNALNSNKADNNTGIGEYSLYNNSTGIKNTGIGGLSGYNTGSGSNVTCIGYNSNPSSTTVNNQITLGDNTITSLRCNTTTITSLSDARDKKNIRDLTLGIDFIMKLRPRLYNWDKREWYENNISDGSKMNETPSAGFIAQELDTVQTTENAEYLNLVLKDNPEKIEATPGNLLPIVVKALQDLRTENVELKSELELLKTQMAEIKNEFSLHAPKNTTNGNSVVNK
jgi:hypothetical protein